MTNQRSWSVDGKPQEEQWQVHSLCDVHQSNALSPEANRILPPHVHRRSPLESLPCTTPQVYGQFVRPSDSDRSTMPNPVHHYDHFVSEHEIKFTRNEMCTPFTCICFFIAFLFSFMAIISGIYYGLNFFDGKHVKEQVFKVQFAAFLDQELTSVSNLDNVDSNEFKTLAGLVRQRMEQLFSQSSIGSFYIKCEIVAFERRTNRPSQVIVHLNVHITSNKRTVQPAEIFLILAEEITQNKFKLLNRLNIDADSLDVKERKWLPREKSTLLVNPWTYKSMFPGMLEGLSTEATPAPRKCFPIGLSYCHFLQYNRTSYPNVLNHWNLSSVEEEFITFKEIVDSECYALAKEFVCLLLQPECVADEIVLPCKSFCVEFRDACERWLSDRVWRRLTCDTLPEPSLSTDNVASTASIAPTSLVCRGKPSCASTLRLQSRAQHKLCDGVRDCADLSDELNCDYCRSETAHKQFHCGNRQCVPLNATCDGTSQCRNRADELDCFALVSNPQHPNETHLPQGYLMATFKARQAPVCVESGLTTIHNYSHTYYNNQMQVLGLNICNERHFQELIRIEGKPASVKGPFSKFVPSTTLISAGTSHCASGHIYYIQCGSAKCGVGIAPEWSAVCGRPSDAFAGNWPWFAKLNLNDNYLCDGTLIAEDTVLAQATCFSTTDHDWSHNHNLTVTLGSVRLHQDNVEADKFTVSQVTSSSMTQSVGHYYLVRLTKTINATRFIRPVCLNQHDLRSNLSSLQCAVLNLNFEFDRLQSRPVSIVSMEKCHTNFTRQQNDSEKYQVCVQLSEAKCTEPNLTTDYITSFNSGRHLYCQFRLIWYLVGLESLNNNNQTFGDEPTQYVLFDSLSKTNF